MSKQFPGVDIDAVHGGRMPMTTDAKLLLTDEELAAAWNGAKDTRDEQNLGDLYLHYMRSVAQAQLKKCESSPRYVLPGQWIDPKDALPDEGRAVFFMTKSAHWAGERLLDSWLGSFDGDRICSTVAVLRWQYAPASLAYPDTAASISGGD